MRCIVSAKYYNSPHPRDYDCPTCGVKSPAHCVSKNGKKIAKVEKMHIARHRLLGGGPEELKCNEENPHLPHVWGLGTALCMGVRYGK
jgi:hypothetical protein